jgi:hypothetical protein
MTEVVVNLLHTCNAERTKGTDFPTIWKDVLKGHPCVKGLPIQDRGEGGPILRIPLTTGQFLLFLGSHFSILEG